MLSGNLKGLANSAWYFFWRGGGKGAGQGKIFGRGFFEGFNGSPRNFWVLIFVRIRSSLKLGVPLLRWVYTSPRWRAVRRSRYVILPW